jgi:hypothetical protein
VQGFENAGQGFFRVKGWWKSFGGLELRGSMPLNMPLIKAYPSSRLRRILGLLAEGEVLWEIPKRSESTVFNPKTGKDVLVRNLEVLQMEDLGWIRKLDNSQPNRLDSWEITPDGRDVMISRPRQ